MANHHPSPPMAMQMHHGPAQQPPPQAPQQMGSSYQTSRQMHALNEAVWIQIGKALEAHFSHVKTDLG